MGIPPESLVERVGRWLRGPWPAAVMVTVITVATVGTIVLVATDAGCDLGQNLTGSKCSSGTKTGFITTPTPSDVYSPLPSPLITLLPTQAPSSPVPQTVAGEGPGNPYVFAIGGVSPALPPPTYPDGARGDPPPQLINFTCRLPLSAGPSGSGGFLVLPDKSYVPDPRSGVIVSPAPTMPSYFGLAYDATFTRWLPVPRRWVSPDGARYAYPGPEGIFVDDLTTASVTEIGAGRPWNLLDAENAGVYASPPFGAAGLWWLPLSGAPQEVTGAGYWQAIGGGAAYGLTTESVPAGAANTVIRLDLNTGGATPQPWILVSGTQVSPFGFDQHGNLLVTVAPESGSGPISEVWDVYGLGKAEVLYGSAGGFSETMSDSHGIWLAVDGGITLIVPGLGSNVVTNIYGEFAGPCV